MRTREGRERTGRERRTRPRKSMEMDEMSPNEESPAMGTPTDSVEARREKMATDRCWSRLCPSLDRSQWLGQETNERSGVTIEERDLRSDQPMVNETRRSRTSSEMERSPKKVLNKQSIELVFLIRDDLACRCLGMMHLQLIPVRTGMRYRRKKST